MKALPFILCALLLPLASHAQLPAPEEVLSRSIAHHDPDGAWGTFRGQFRVVMETPGEAPRTSDISLDQRRGHFRLDMERAGVAWGFEVLGDRCVLRFNGEESFPEPIAREYRLTCERARMYKNYYSYLYGLPMKLRDQGAILSPEVRRTTFHGKPAWVLEVRYAPGVGTDLWYFYFNPETYALEAYQFYHDKAKNDGEYILLEGEARLGGMRLPRVRTWYTNKEGKLLGTDTLQNL